MVNTISFLFINIHKTMITLITGGARSGKSSYAQEAALQLSNSPVYIATAKPYADDAEFKQRIDRHKKDRDERWTSIEEQLHVSKLDLSNKVVVIDCVTLWLTNFFSLYKYDIDQSLQAIKEEIDGLKKINATFFIISNEIGMGVHAETEIGRKFTDLQGWTNQHIAQQANKVVLMVSGIAVAIKN
ncbi:bifunctional adenosylcobalamin biosynthesis protein CobU [mine drainage metagenome]|uniref:Adenosylcobinamide kinase n=1 Tax=mine drainage metagenome TaxID=410659 RepID=A0A1J5SAU9_9ZZZZ